MVTCNHCGSAMESLVLTAGSEEIYTTKAYEPYMPEYWFYICPKCGNVQAHKIEEEEK